MKTLSEILNQKEDIGLNFSSCLKEPTMDSNGRFHSPCDGFEYEGVIYNAGQYLHIDGYSTNKSKIRVKVASSDIENLKNFPEFSGSGNVWNQKGIDVCYAYLEVSDKKSKQIRDLMVPNKILILDQDRDNDCGKPFKLKIKRSINLNLNMGLCPEMIDAELQNKGMFGVKWSFDKKGKVVVPFEGKMVCFRYMDDIIKV